MKQLIQLVLLVLALSVATEVSAQTTSTLPGVAFVNASRTALFLKQQDSTIKTVLQSTPPFFAISKLALLGETPGGKNLLLAGSFTYNTTTFTGIINVPSNLDLSNPALILQQIKFLFPAPNGVTAFRPIGGVTTDGNNWFVCFVSTSQGNISPTFYHGSMNADISTNPQIDSGVLKPDNAVSVYHMTNMAISPDNSTIVVVIADHLDAEPSLRFQRVRWAPSGPFAGINVTEFHSNVGSLNQNVLSKDSMFGFGLRMLPSNNQAELLLANVGTTDNSLQAFQFSWSANNVDLTHQTWSIPRSSIPEDMNFFAGFNGVGYNEDNPYSQQHGNAGDIYFRGDSAVFVTHEAPDNIGNRKAKSAIYIYDIGSQTASLFYNDQNAQELQPIFVDVPYIIPPTPGEIALSIGSLDFGTLDSAATAQKTVDVTDTSASNSLPVVVDSVTITGQNASDFVLSGGPATPYSLSSTDKKTYTITYTARGAAGTRKDTLNVFFNHGVAGSPRKTSMTAKVNAVDHTQKSVHEDPALAANVTISPNPFVNAATIRLTSQENCALAIVVRDEMGRTVYASDIRKVVSGVTESFDFGAKALGLPSGTYYVSAIFGERQITRQIVFVK